MRSFFLKIQMLERVYLFHVNVNEFHTTPAIRRRFESRFKAKLGKLENKNQEEQSSLD